MNADIIHCRLSSATLKRLDNHAAQLRAAGVPPRLATRSSIVRTLLTKQLDVDPKAHSTIEVASQTQKLLQATSARALKRILDRLPNAIDTIVAESAGATLQQIIANALHRVCADMPDAEAITREVLAEEPSSLTMPLRKR